MCCCLRMFHVWKELEFMWVIMSTHFSAKSAARYTPEWDPTWSQSSRHCWLARNGLWSKLRQLHFPSHWLLLTFRKWAAGLGWAVATFQDYFSLGYVWWHSWMGWACATGCHVSGSLGKTKRRKLIGRETEMGAPGYFCQAPALGLVNLQAMNFHS